MTDSLFQHQHVVPSERQSIFLSSMCSTADQKQFIKGDFLKFNDGSSKLLSGHKFQDKYVVLRAENLLLYRDIKVRTLLSSV